MLVLTRKPNQQLQIGNDIVITIVKVRGNTIRLGIEAPRDVRVIRSELDPKEDKKLAAEKSSHPSLNNSSDTEDGMDDSRGDREAPSAATAELAGSKAPNASELGAQAVRGTVVLDKRAEQAKTTGRRNAPIKIGRDAVKQRAPLARGTISALAIPSRS